MSSAVSAVNLLQKTAIIKQNKPLAATLNHSTRIRSSGLSWLDLDGWWAFGEAFFRVRSWLFQSVKSDISGIFDGFRFRNDE